MKIDIQVRNSRGLIAGTALYGLLLIGLGSWGVITERHWTAPGVIVTVLGSLMGSLLLAFSGYLAVKRARG